MMTAPEISVIMPVYNASQYLKEAVDSILSQTYSDFELIVVDDGSTDSTLGILSGIDDRRLKIVGQPHAGITSALNMGIRCARGRYIARMDADDISLPTRFEKQVAYLQNHPEVGMIGSEYLEIDSGGRVIGERHLPLCDREIRAAIIKYNPFCHSSVMIRRGVLDMAGLYDERFCVAQDYELWFRVIRHTQVANIGEPLVMHRVHGNALAVTTRDEQLKAEVKARGLAILSGQYRPWYAVHLVRPLLVLALPRAIRVTLRRRRAHSDMK